MITASIWLAFVAAIVLKAGFQKADREGKPITQVAIEMFSRGASEKKAEEPPKDFAPRD